MIIVPLPADRRDLRTAFEQLASRNGWRQFYLGLDEATGAQVIVTFDADPDHAAITAQSGEPVMGRV